MKDKTNPLDALIGFCLENKLVVVLFAAGLIFWGVIVAPFDWRTGGLPRDPVPVDAIPDIGENQQIVFTKWIGRSPQDIEDQISYPLTSALLGLPKVKTVRSNSMFGFSSIYIIFEEDAEFYWSRSRILEKLNSLPSELLPDGVTPQLGPDATALGQVFWYTIEGFTPQGDPSGGWDLQELRSAQDWYVRYALQGVDGVAEVASIGGFVKEYQIDVDPDALRAYGLTLSQVFDAVRSSNLDVGARTIEVNAAEYVIRGVGLIKSLDDLRRTVVTQRQNVPITLDKVANIEYGPALRRGALDKAGAEAVGGVVVTRYGENPLEVIKRVKAKIDEITPGLPNKVLEDGTSSQLRIVPFYDRSGLINETLGTLENAVRQQILITVIVVLLLVLHLRSATLISGILPLAVLFCFIGMKLLGVDANIVALSGIAIAIGTIVDMGIVLVENILRHIQKAEESRRLDSGKAKSSLTLVRKASAEVSGAIVTAVLTTIISFLPVFTMEAAEGKLFRPLAYTKTLTLAGSILVALVVIPPLAHWLLTRRFETGRLRYGLWFAAILCGLIGPLALDWFPLWLGALMVAVGVFHLIKPRLTSQSASRANLAFNLLIALGVALYLAADWQPLGPEHSVKNALFVILSIGILIGGLALFIRFYTVLLGWILNFKWLFLSFCSIVILFALTTWLGFASVFRWAPTALKETKLWSQAVHALPPLGKEFMPNLDEGSFLFMPTTMPHASIGEVMDVLRKQDMAINALPEVESAIGKLGRVDSPLDPAPISMIETIINYKSEYKTDAQGNLLTFAFDQSTRTFERDSADALIPDPDGRPYRQWRDSIQSPDDIWAEIVAAANIPGTTSAPELQPIAARVVMLQSGVRAPMAYQVRGPDLETIERVSLELEAMLKRVPAINPDTVFADRVIGKPYLEIEIDREAIARYGIRIQNVQDVIEVAIGGKQITQTVEGRERYPVRVRYQRELRDSPEDIGNILVASPDGTQIPLKELASINYLRGPQVIKSEDTFLVGYVIFDKQLGESEVDVVEQANAFIADQLASRDWALPAGVPLPRAIGSYENQVRAEKKLAVVLPISLLAIWLILYFNFKRVSTTLFVFTGVAFAWAGGFLLIWLYGQSWFLDLSVLGLSLRELFQVGPISLSVAVWVGFLALFGIATDDGVLMATYLDQRFKESPPSSHAEIKQRVIEAASRRIRPAMMTTATTLLALLPVLTSSGRGSDVMVPMAIPTFGGMLLAILSVFVVPTLYCIREELRTKTSR